MHGFLPKSSQFLLACLRALVALSLSPLPVIAQFDAYNWTLVKVGAQSGSGWVSGDQMHVAGSDSMPGGASGPGSTRFEMVVPYNGLFSFELSYQDLDYEPCYDYALYSINGQQVFLCRSTCTHPVSFYAHSGDVIGLGIYSVDSCCGPGIADFTQLAFQPGDCDEAEVSHPTAPSAAVGGIAIGPERLLVGFPTFDKSVRAYARDGLEWIAEATLLGSAVPSSKFGTAIALDGDRALISDTGTHRAFLYHRGPAGWSLEATLSSPSPASTTFAAALALRGDYALVGAPEDTLPSGGVSGRVHVYRHAAGTWVLDSSILPPPGVPSKQFGRALALDGDRVVIGTYAVYPALFVPGSAYVFRRAGIAWIQEAKLAPADLAGSDSFGCSVSLSGDTALIGACFQNSPGGGTSGVSEGAAYVFVDSGGGSWGQQAKFIMSDTTGNWASGEYPCNAGGGGFWESFGQSVAVDHDVAVIGAPGDDVTLPFAGAAYVFRRTAGVWSQEAKYVATLGKPGYAYGKAVALSGESAVIAAYDSAHVRSLLHPACAILKADASGVSGAQGGTQALAVDAGSAHAGELYLLLGSATGTAPGSPIDGVVVPLNTDPYLLYSLQSPNHAYLHDTLGHLDAGGKALASIQLQAGEASALAGLTLHHALVLLDATGGYRKVELASNPTALTLLP